MKLSGIFSDIQMTTVLVILLQILSSTHMFPISSPNRRSELDLLLDPVYQAEQDVQETKKIVTKSVFHTVLRVPEDQGCPQDMQRVKSKGPCVTRYESPSGPVYDESYRLAALKELTRNGAHTNTNKRKRPNNRHRGSTTPKSTTTTDVPIEVSTLQDLEDGGGGGGLVDMTSTKMPFMEVTETQTPDLIYMDPTMIVTTRLTTKLDIRPDPAGTPKEETENLSTTQQSILDSSDVHPNIGENVTKDPSAKPDVKAEMETNFTKSISNPIEFIVELSSMLNTTEDENVTLDALRNYDELTTIKPDLNNNDEKRVPAMMMMMGMGQTQSVRVSTDETFTEDPLIFISNSTEDPGVSFYNQDEEESYTTTFTSADPLQTDTNMDQISPGISSTTDSSVIESYMKLEEEANDSFAAVTSSSSPLILEIVGDQNLKGFNYTEIRSDNLMTDRSTPTMPDIAASEIITSPQPMLLFLNTSVSDNSSSEIDSTPTSFLETSAELERKRTIAEIEIDEMNNSENIKSTTLPSFEAETTAPENVNNNEEESTTIRNIPEPQLRFPQFSNSNQRQEESEQRLSSEIGPHSHNDEGELDRIHHRSRTRNRIKNPDFSETPQEESQEFLFNESKSHHDLIAKDFQSQSRSFSEPSAGFGMIGSSNRYPQQFVSLDYLRLGDNYRRFRVF